MSYRCLRCKFRHGSRKIMRAHVRSVHRVKGKPLAPPSGNIKYLPSDISAGYEWVVR